MSTCIFMSTCRQIAIQWKLLPIIFFQDLIFIIYREIFTYLLSIYSDLLDLHARCNIFISTCNIFMRTCLNYIFMSICNIFTCMLRSLLIKYILKIYMNVNIGWINMLICNFIMSACN